MKEIVFATNNPHKLQEINAIIGDRFRVLGLKDIGCNEDIPEEADTIEGNASAKARYIYHHYGMNCFADDTGLEVEALGGQPGVKSARYAGDDCNPEHNIRKLLEALTASENRKARFRTIISLIIDGEEKLFEGVVEGQILKSKHGVAGFGYDPVFLPDGWSLSFAEMAPEDKNRISHRGIAVRKLIDFLTRTASFP